MRAYKCDRCKEYFDIADRSDLDIVYEMYEAQRDRHINRKIDLCPKCQRAQRIFLSKGTFTADEVEIEVYRCGRHDPRFKPLEKIKYAPSEIAQILKHGIVIDPEVTTSTTDM